MLCSCLWQFSEVLCTHIHCNMGMVRGSRLYTVPRLSACLYSGSWRCVGVCVCVTPNHLSNSIAFAVKHHFYSSVRTAAMFVNAAPCGLSSLSAQQHGYVQSMHPYACPFPLQGSPRTSLHRRVALE